MSFKSLIVFATLLLDIGTSLAVEDRCADVLRDGALQTLNIENNTLLQQVYFASQQSTTKENRFRDRQGQLVTPLGALGASDRAFSKFYSNMNSATSIDTLFRHRSQVAASAGDPEITRSWLDCMRSREPGLIAHFESVDGTRAILRLEWQAPTFEAMEAIITQDSLPQDSQVKVVSGADLLRRGARHKHRVRSSIEFQLASATVPLMVIVRTNRGDVEAYLPPRVKLTTESALFPLKGVNAKEAGVYAERGDYVEGDVVCEDAPEGWLFRDKESISFNTRTELRQPLRCKGELHSWEPERICYRANMGIGVRGDHNCIASPQARLIRWKWVSVN